MDSVRDALRSGEVDKAYGIMANQPNPDTTERELTFMIEQFLFAAQANQAHVEQTSQNYLNHY